MFEENIPGSLLLYNEILSKGFDGHNFIAGLAEHFRNLLVCKDAATISLLEVGQNIQKRYKEQSEKTSTPFLLRALKVVNTCDVNFKSARNQRLLVEFALMQLTAISGALISGEKNDEPKLIFGTKASPISATTPVLERKSDAEQVNSVNENLIAVEKVRQLILV